MKIIKKIRLLFYFSVLSLMLMSSTILIMPVVGDKVRILLGAAFWIFTVIGYALLIVANFERRWFINNKMDGNVQMDCLPGFATFFDNIPATIADTVMIISFIIFVICMITKLKYEYISYIVLFLLLLSVNMHCLFNGRVYKATKIKRIKGDEIYE